MKGTQTVRRRFLYIELHIMFLFKRMSGSAKATNADAAALKPAIDEIADACVAHRKKGHTIVFFLGHGAISSADNLTQMKILNQAIENQIDCGCRVAISSPRALQHLRKTYPSRPDYIYNHGVGLYAHSEQTITYVNKPASMQNQEAMYRVQQDMIEEKSCIRPKLDGERLVVQGCGQQENERDRAYHAEVTAVLGNKVNALNRTDPGRWTHARYPDHYAIERSIQPGGVARVTLYLDFLAEHQGMTREQFLAKALVIYIDGGDDEEAQKAMQYIQGIESTEKNFLFKDNTARSGRTISISEEHHDYADAFFSSGSEFFNWFLYLSDRLNPSARIAS